MTSAVHTFYLARQPIYDASLKLAGYELLFRSGDVGHAQFVNGDQATSEVITSAVVDIGLDTLVGEHPAFINATSGFLNGDFPLPELKGKIVLEVLEDITVDEALIARVNQLSQAGYRLALDDFVYQPGCEALLSIADFVKLDVCALTAAELTDHVKRIKAHGPKLIAEKVETYEMLAACQKLGFDLFQGYFFCRPKLISGKRPEANRLSVLQLITRLNDPACGIEEMEQLVTADPALSYRLLKYINSAYCGMRVTVTSIRQALVLVGTDLIRSWATLLLMSRLSDGKPSELIVTALIRARMCQLIGTSDAAEGGDPQDDNKYFTVGLLSVLDALIDQPMDDIVSGLPFNEEVCSALRGREGVLGETLGRVVAYEQHVMIDPELAEGLGDLYIEALRWANETKEALAA